MTTVSNVEAVIAPHGHIHATLTGAPPYRGMVAERIAVSLNKACKPGSVAIRAGNRSWDFHLGGWRIQRLTRPAPRWVLDAVAEMLWVAS